MSTTNQSVPPVMPKPHSTDDVADLYKHRYVTIPNIICAARIVGSFGLFWLARDDYVVAFVIAFVVLRLSDSLDGWLARVLHQRSDFGAWLDSVSDAILNLCLIIGCLILKWDVLKSEAIWLAMPLLTFAISTGYGAWKYGRMLSYHTFAAKKSNWVAMAGAIALLLDWSVWPMRIAAIAVTLTNLEAMAITYVLSEWKADVSSLFRVLQPRTTTEQGQGP